MNNIRDAPPEGNTHGGKTSNLYAWYESKINQAQIDCKINKSSI